MNRNFVETLMGALVLLVAASFLFISYKSGNIASGVGGYPVVAKFKEVGSLGLGSDVRIGGIKVGSVTAQALDNKTYMPMLTMTIKSGIELPKDSSAAIVSDGLLGGKYVAIEPGGDEDMLRANDEIKYTQDAVNLESLIGKFAFGSVKDGDAKAKDAAPAPAK